MVARVAILTVGPVAYVQGAQGSEPRPRLEVLLVFEAAQELRFRGRARGRAVPPPPRHRLEGALAPRSPRPGALELTDGPGENGARARARFEEGATVLLRSRVVVAIVRGRCFLELPDVSDRVRVSFRRHPLRGLRAIPSSRRRLHLGALVLCVLANRLKVAERDDFLENGVVPVAPLGGRGHRARFPPRFQTAAGLLAVKTRWWWFLLLIVFVHLEILPIVEHLPLPPRACEGCRARRGLLGARELPWIRSDCPAARSRLAPRRAAATLRPRPRFAPRRFGICRPERFGGKPVEGKGEEEREGWMMISTSYKAKDYNKRYGNNKSKRNTDPSPSRGVPPRRHAILVSVHGSPLWLALLSPVVDSALCKVGGNALGHALSLVRGRLFSLDLGEVPGQTARIAHAVLDLAPEGAEGELIPASALASFASVQSFRRLELRPVSEEDDSAAVDDVGLHARRVKVL